MCRPAIDRLLPALSARLTEKGRGARRVRLQAFRADGRVEVVEVGLARPSADPDRIRPLLALKLDRIDAGFGIDCLRLEALDTEPVHAVQHRGHLDAAASASARQTSDTALEDLIGKLGARLGMEAVTRLHPAESHIPEKSAVVLAAAWSAPAPAPWPEPRAPRPLQLFRPEPVTAPEVPQVPARFRWRRRDLAVVEATGPERIAPEWWLDDPEWRSGAARLLACDDGCRRAALAVLRPRRRGVGRLVLPGPLRLIRCHRRRIRPPAQPAARCSARPTAVRASSRRIRSTVSIARSLRSSGCPSACAISRRKAIRSRCITG